MCDEIEARLREIFDEEIRTYWNPSGAPGVAASADQSGPSEARRLKLEAQAHQLFGENRAPKDVFVGRDQQLKAIDDYLRDENDRKPLVVHGPSGTGKTALLARAAQAAEKGERRVIVRFLGTTPQSSNLRSLLQNLCRALRPAGEVESQVSAELRELQEEFDRLLALATAEKPILVFLDALDQLDEADGAHQTYWLRTPLPSHVKVVVSCIRDDEGPAELNEPNRFFEQRKLLDRAIAVEALTAPDAIRAIDLWLQRDERRHGRRRHLTKGQLDAIAARITPDLATACRRALYLRILFEECRLWPSWKAVRADELGENTAALLEGLFERLALSAVHGSLLVESVLSYIACARRGLSESEVLEVLWADPDYRQHLHDVSLKTSHELPSGATRIPIAIWSRLRHRRLARYFQSELQPWWCESVVSRQIAEATAAQRVPNARRATELPWQLLHEADESDPGHETPAVWDAPTAVLCDLEFVEVKCAAGLVFELQEDYRNTIGAMPEAQEGPRQERERQARLARWTEEIITYSRQWSERRDRKARGEVVVDSEPRLPELPATCRMWTEEEIEANCQRIIENPTRLDRVRAFAGFVEQGCYPLLDFGFMPGFALQQGFNHAPSGPVRNVAHGMLPRCNAPLLLRRWPAAATWNPNAALLRTLEGHSYRVSTLSITPDGQRAVSGSDDKTLRVWDLKSGACVRTMKGHLSSVRSVSVTADGRQAASGHEDGAVCLWDIESGSCLRTFGESIVNLEVGDLKFDFRESDGHSARVAGLSITPDGRRVVSGSVDKTLRVWDSESGECLRTLEGHRSTIASVSVTADGLRAVSASQDRMLRVWDVESGACLRELEGHTGPVNSISVTADELRAVSGSWDNTLRVWDLESGACLRQLNGHSESVESVSVTADGRFAVSGSEDRTLRMWDIESGVCLRTLEGHSGNVHSVSVTSDGRRAVSGSLDRTLRVWNLEDGSCMSTFDGYGMGINILCATPNGRLAVSTSVVGRYEQYAPRVWDIEQGICLRTLKGHTDNVNCIKVTSDGLRVVSGSCDKTLRVWDIESGACLRQLKGHSQSVDSVSVTLDGRFAVSGSRDRTVRIWDLEGGVCLHTLEGHTENVESVSVTPDGRRAVSGSYDKTLRVWDIESGSCLHTLKGHRDWVKSVDVTPDGRRLVSMSDGHRDTSVRVWDLESGACLHNLDARSAVVVSPNGRHAVSSSSPENLLEIWDLESGACLRTLKGHSQWVSSVSFTPDGRRVVTGSDDRTVRVWDIESGLCEAVFIAPSGVRHIAILSTLILIGTSVGQLLRVEMGNLPLEPVIVPDPSDTAFEALLRRGLDLSLQGKGADHEETVAHRTALALHLERIRRQTKQ